MSASSTRKYPGHIREGAKGQKGPLSNINSPQYAPQTQALEACGLFLWPNYLCLPATNPYYPTSYTEPGIFLGPRNIWHWQRYINSEIRAQLLNGPGLLMLLDEELWVGERLGVDYSSTLIMCNYSSCCPQHCLQSTRKSGSFLWSLVRDKSGSQPRLLISMMFQPLSILSYYFSPG